MTKTLHEKILTATLLGAVLATAGCSSPSKYERIILGQSTSQDVLSAIFTEVPDAEVFESNDRIAYIEYAPDLRQEMVMVTRFGEGGVAVAKTRLLVDSMLSPVPFTTDERYVLHSEMFIPEQILQKPFVQAHQRDVQVLQYMRDAIAADCGAFLDNREIRSIRGMIRSILLEAIDAVRANPQMANRLITTGLPFEHNVYGKGKLYLYDLGDRRFQVKVIGGAWTDFANSWGFF